MENEGESMLRENLGSSRIEVEDLVILGLKASDQIKPGSNIRCRASRIESLLYILVHESKLKAQYPPLHWLVSVYGPIFYEYIEVLENLEERGYVKIFKPVHVAVTKSKKRIDTRNVYDSIVFLTDNGLNRARELFLEFPEVACDVEYFIRRFAFYSIAEIKEYIYEKFFRTKKAIVYNE